GRTLAGIVWHRLASVGYPQWPCHDPPPSGGKMPDKVFIFDTTLRDGEQSPGSSMNLPEKIEMAHQLERLGVDILEAGFPIASQGDFEAVKGAARPRIHTFLATSDIHLQYKLHKTREEILKMLSWAVGYAKSKCQDV